MKASHLLKRIVIALTALLMTVVAVMSTGTPASFQVAHASTQAQVTYAPGVVRGLSRAAGNNYATGMKALPSPVVVGEMLPPIPDAGVTAYSFAVSHGPILRPVGMFSTGTLSDSKRLLSQSTYSGPTASRGPRPEIAPGMPLSAEAGDGNYLMPAVTLITLLVLGLLGMTAGARVARRLSRSRRGSLSNRLPEKSSH